MEFELIRKMVTASGVKEGEIILIHYWGEDAHIEVMRNFAVAVADMGATPITLQQSRIQNKHMFEVAKSSSFDGKYFSMFDHIDAVLDVFAYQPVVLNYELSKEQMQLYRNYMRNLFDALMKAKRFTQIRIPTIDNAQESTLTAEDYVNRMTNAYDIDYDKLKMACEEKIKELKVAKSIVLHTGNDCQLTLSFGNREWIADCGDGDWPCGEVYIAPVEEATEGRIYYQKLYLEEVGEFEDVILSIKEGVVDSSNHGGINEFLASITKEDKVVCELGFGLNEKVTSLCGYALLDEKMQNTFHIAIGNNTMFGGKNEANLHMDFVGTGSVELKPLG